MKKIFFIFFMIWITIIIAGGFYFLTLESEDNNSVSIDNIVESTVEVPKITTMLADKRYISLELKIQTDSKNTAEELSKREFQIKNIIVQELSDLSRKDLEGKPGKKLLQDLLKKEINNILNNGEVVQVYITSYVVQ